jgi:hypothetical protein
MSTLFRVHPCNTGTPVRGDQKNLSRGPASHGIPAFPTGRYCGENKVAPTSAMTCTREPSTLESPAKRASCLHISSAACALPHRPIEHPNILRLAGPFGLPALARRRRAGGRSRPGVTPTRLTGSRVQAPSPPLPLLCGKSQQPFVHAHTRRTSKLGGTDRTRRSTSRYETRGVSPIVATPRESIQYLSRGDTM